MRLAHTTTVGSLALLFALSDLDLGGRLACRVKVYLHLSSTRSGETFGSIGAADLRLGIVVEFHFPFRGLDR